MPGGGIGVTGFISIPPVGLESRDLLDFVAHNVLYIDVRFMEESSLGMVNESRSLCHMGTWRR